MGKKISFENSRKTIETIFDIIFWINLVSLVFTIFFAMFAGGKLNALSIAETIVGMLLVFYAARQAHKGTIYAGILGLIASVLYLLTPGGLYFYLGIFLIIDSILYIVNFKR